MSTTFELRLLINKCCHYEFSIFVNYLKKNVNESLLYIFKLITKVLNGSKYI